VRPALLVTVVVLSCGGGQQPGTGAPGRRPPVEDVWLATVGSGPPQNARVCARGAGDPVARAFCAQPAPEIDSLQRLLQVLNLDKPFPARVEATTTHSLGLTGRAVTALNPRVVFAAMTVPDNELRADRTLAVAFSRGEQFVELAAYDPDERTLNLYLGHFRQSCNAGGAGCGPLDLLGPGVETGWREFTLYAAEDLEDTPLDCLSCHQRSGGQPDVGRRLRFLMRQFSGPWLHWAGPVTSRVDCAPEGFARLPDLLTLRAAITGETHYAGVALADLESRDSGRDLEAFIALANVAAGLGQELTPGALFPSMALGEPYVLPSEAVLQESLCGIDPVNWRRYRDAVLTVAGLPVPFHAPDVLDRSDADALAGRFAERLAASTEEAFSLAASWLSDEAAEGSGFRFAAGNDPALVLRQACVRCHGPGTRPDLRRARFNVEALAHLAPEQSREVIRRLSLPADDPQAMPPARAVDLAPAMRQSLIDHVRSACGPACSP
jgi:mono/diheme cytochrome c family protein